MSRTKVVPRPGNSTGWPGGMAPGACSYASKFAVIGHDHALWATLAPEPMAWRSQDLLLWACPVRSLPVTWMFAVLAHELDAEGDDDGNPRHGSHRAGTGARCGRAHPRQARAAVRRPSRAGDRLRGACRRPAADTGVAASHPSRADPPERASTGRENEDRSTSWTRRSCRSCESSSANGSTTGLGCSTTSSTRRSHKTTVRPFARAGRLADGKRRNRC